MDKSKKRIFVDMDGTLSRFHDEVQYLERMWEKDFFKNLKPFENMVIAVDELSKNPRYEVYILSAAVDGEPPYCQSEKNEWLDKYLPSINKEHRIFTRVGENKADFIPNGIANSDVLIDDYNKNLDEWQQFGGTAVKCVNNINNKGLVGKLWDGLLIKNSEQPENILVRVNTITTPQISKGRK